MNYAFPLEVAARRWPDRVAVSRGAEELTFADLDQRVTQVAGALRDLGIGHGDHVASYMVNSLETLELYFALARLGAVSVPVNSRLTDAEVARLVADSGPALIAVDEQFTAGRDWAGLGLPLVVTQASRTELPRLRELADDQPRHAQFDIVDADDVATILYTSGTTGRPKGVVRTHGANTANAVNVCLAVERSETDIEVFTLPLHGIGLMHFVVPCLIRGTHLSLMEKFEPTLTWSLIEERKPTRIFLAPTMIAAMLEVPDHERYDTSSLRAIDVAYEFSPRLRKAALERFGNKFFHLYGLTEAQLTYPRAGLLPTAPSCVGKPMGVCDISIRDLEDAEVAAGEVGEICLRGPSLMSGYYRMPEETAASLRDGWLHTGDLGRIDEEGDLHYAGRRNQMIKSGGFNVDPVEVENVIADHASVREAAVVGVIDERWGEKVVGFVVPAEPSLSVEELTRFARSRLAGFKSPKEIVVLDELPKNATGKVERATLRQIYVDRPTSRTASQNQTATGGTS